MRVTDEIRCWAVCDYLSVRGFDWQCGITWPFTLAPLMCWEANLHASIVAGAHTMHKDFISKTNSFLILTMYFG